ncbi:class I mannose-6-phosphate isomerase [Sphingomonas sp. KR1UV-12]|uniref:Class I mannose-6-phosphate isomerase n=1 Tax=Sphingomonas aurea TaxID=3063994 RepID=A0ABT9EJW3_9SPHN|nr:class I mannose-6-phosphate isomerase [Sphingomonas sp. KR1UV-12]MDP1027229.1 class I mannose-6-phosphate isomerase [Sphingomonas sp. KR1UV-12]
MPATLLHTHRVEKPWGRRDLFPGFDDVAEGGEPVGEVWFQEPGDSTPDLLIKYLFTGEKLSVQVHPDDEQAHKRGLPRGKDECWTILAAAPDSTIALGPKQHINADALRAAALDGSIEDKLDWVPVRAGDFYYAPSGTIHAIGAGLTLIEVQQNSETTYRLYDYGRPRELHLDDGVAVAHLDPYRPIQSPGPVDEHRTVLVEGPKFVLERWKGGAEHRVALPDGLTAWIVPIAGTGEVAGVAFKAGECATVTGSETITTSADADYLLAYPGTKRI